mgnify:CR=1 FL=1
MNTIIAGFTNWKTTLAGLGIALLTTYQAGGFTDLHGASLTAAIGAVVFGFLTKDATKTGAPQ